MSSGRTRVAIVGGGISGLTAAYRLTRPPALDKVEVTLFESSSRLGGTVQTLREDGFTVECGPDAWVSEKPGAHQLVEELGLGHEVIPSNDRARRTYLLQGRTLLPMPSGMRMMVPTDWGPLLCSEFFSTQAKLDYLREPKRAEELKSRALRGQDGDADESVADFVRRHFGEEITSKIAGPLLAGIFGGDIEQLSVAATMAPFVTMEAEEGSLITALRRHQSGRETGAATFTTLQSGLGTLPERLAAELPRTTIRRSCRVLGLRRNESFWTLETEAGPASFDIVVLATSLDATRTLLRSTGLEPALASADLLPREASSAIIVGLGFRASAAMRMRVPRGFGFLAPAASIESATASEEPQLLACTFADQKFASRVPEGGILLRAFFGGSGADALLGAQDERLVTLAHRQLGRVLGSLPPPDLTVVRRWPRSLPLYNVGHGKRISEMQKWMQTLPAIHLLGNAYRGVGLPDLVRDANAVALAVAGSH